MSDFPHASFSLYDKCTLCPRRCQAKRLDGQKGFCGASATCIAGAALAHHWEEPIICPETGSGTVFFSCCPLRCVYCQNHVISHEHQGRVVTVDMLAQSYLNLQEQGVGNINLVTAGHFLPHVIASLEIAKTSGLSLPIIYNSSAYENVDSLRRLEGLIDIYLPDLKLQNQYHAQKYLGASDYCSVATRAIEEMFRQVGACRFDSKGQLLSRGLIVRILLLPGLVKEAKAALAYLHTVYGDQIYISLMRQYTPMPWIAQTHPELNRPVQDEEYEALLDFAVELGVTRAFTQEKEAISESFIPLFEGQGFPS